MGKARRPGRTAKGQRLARPNGAAGRGAVAAIDAALWTRGCVREPDPVRRKKDGPSYKKGHEVRLSTTSSADARRLASQLRAAGLRAGKPYAHHSGFVVPVYGREAVEWFRGQA